MHFRAVFTHVLAVKLPWRPFPVAGTDGDASEIPGMTNVMLV